MDATASNHALDGPLDLDRIAVGPYCPFDAFRPSTSAPPKFHALPNHSLLSKVKMEAPIMSNEYAFPNPMQQPWITTAEDDITLVAPVDALPRGDWNEWMQWDPAASQNPDAKPLHVQGPACFRKPEQRPPPIFNRRQSSQLREPSIGLSMDIPTSGPMPTRTAFTLGEQEDIPPAFAFTGNPLSSPSSVDAQQQNGFYSPPLWQQQQQQQQQQSGDSSGFSASRFDPPGSSSGQAPPLSTPSLDHSPSSLHNGRPSSSSAHSSPEPAPSNPKKRKSTSEDIEEPTKSGKGQPVKKTAHNMIEKRYRNNLNDKIAALRDSVPSLRVMSRGNGNGEEEDDPEDLEGLTPAHKLNKATVLSKATEYIRHLEKRNKRLQEEVNTLKTRVDNYEKLAISGSMALHSGVGTPDGNRYQEDPFAPPAGMSMSGPPQGLIPVPEGMSNLHRGIQSQQHYAPAYPTYTTAPGRPGLSGPPLINSRRSSGMVGKLMVGSLAGLMVLEGLVEHEQSSGQAPSRRGLFALPLNLAALLAPRVSIGAASAQLPLAKLLLIFGAVFYIIAPLLDFRSKPKKKSTHIALARAPSLASPVEVRRKAWLTAIQTVWVPQHTFMLEVAALGLKTLKLSTRKLIGWHGYALLTGITREQEAARVKAWTIALDAQLTGGDAEISISRLVLTLMASGTLPDTPALLMLKALHIRVLLWEIANAGYGSWWPLDAISARLSRRYWNAARAEHRMTASTPQGPDNETEQLPAHLVALLDKECDEVLIPNIVQRAYNLAWNRPSAEKTTLDESMDGVVEDFAIGSPLDALAAWYSSHVLKRGLVGYLGSKRAVPKESVKSDLILAADTAPPTSQARTRALVAQAVVFDDDRATHIAAAVEELPSYPSTPSSAKTVQSHRARLINLVGDAPVAADVWKALTLAKCHALTKTSSIEARRRAASVVNQALLPEASMTLLTFVAGYKVLSDFIQDPLLKAQSSQGLERLASSLRMWVGHETGRRIGLSNKARGRVIRHCLDASKILVGLAEPEDIDDGYVSSSVKDDD